VLPSARVSHVECGASKHEGRNDRAPIRSARKRRTTLQCYHTVPWSYSPLPCFVFRVPSRNTQDVPRTTLYRSFSRCQYTPVPMIGKSFRRVEGAPWVWATAWRLAPTGLRQRRLRLPAGRDQRRGSPRLPRGGQRRRGLCGQIRVYKPATFFWDRCFNI